MRFGQDYSSFFMLDELFLWQNLIGSDCLADILKVMIRVFSLIFQNEKVGRYNDQMTIGCFFAHGSMQKDPVQVRLTIGGHFSRRIGHLVILSDQKNPVENSS